MTPPAVVKDLLRVFDVGEEAYQTFKGTGLDDDRPSVKFHDTRTKQRLKSFSTISTKTSRMKGQHVVLKADRNLFSQMILVAGSKSVNMEDVLEHPLGPLLWALANVDGSLRKRRPQLPGSLRKMYLMRKLSQLHQPRRESLVEWIWYKG